MYGNWIYTKRELEIKPTSFNVWEDGLCLGYKEAGTVLALYNDEIFDAWDYEVRLIAKIDSLKLELTRKPIDNEKLITIRAEIMALRTVSDYIATMEKIGGIEA